MQVAARAKIGGGYLFGPDNIEQDKYFSVYFFQVMRHTYSQWSYR